MSVFRGLYRVESSEWEYGNTFSIRSNTGCSNRGYRVAAELGQTARLAWRGHYALRGMAGSAEKVGGSFPCVSAASIGTEANVRVLVRCAYINRRRRPFKRSNAAM